MNLFAVKEESIIEHLKLLVEFITKNPNQTRNSITDVNLPENTNYNIGANNLKPEQIIKPKSNKFL